MVTAPLEALLEAERRPRRTARYELRPGTTGPHVRHESLCATHAISASDVCLLETEDPYTRTGTAIDEFEVNSKLESHQQQAIRSIIREFEDCFSTPSRVSETLIAKHRMTVDENARPMHRMPLPSGSEGKRSHPKSSGLDAQRRQY